MPKVCDEMEKGNAAGMLAMQTQAVAFQKVRYKIEAMLEEQKSNGR